ncbi:MAG: hypothetical protein HC875_01060 [Anaerolineales bacterium]|nr:hypothetical protein [Anaerolineales bacterium]
MAKRKRRDPGKKPFQLPPPESKYPIATIAHYGPDSRTVTKIAVGVVNQHDMVLAMERWAGPDVATNPGIKAQILAFIGQHGAKNVIVTDGVIGCPHEEGLDFPEGEDCPFCPYWKGKQGSAAHKRR